MSIYNRCDNCNKPKDDCNDCLLVAQSLIDTNDYNSPMYSTCRRCGSEMRTSKMIEEGTGYICPECDEEDKRYQQHDV